MYVIRLNNVTIQIREQQVFIFDVFHDISEAETHNIIAYLADEGFLDSQKEVNVFFKHKCLFPKPDKATNQKKN